MACYLYTSATHSLFPPAAEFSIAGGGGEKGWTEYEWWWVPHLLGSTAVPTGCLGPDCTNMLISSQHFLKTEGGWPHLPCPFPVPQLVSYFKICPAYWTPHF